MTDRRGSERLDAQEQIRDIVQAELDGAVTHDGSAVAMYKNVPDGATFPYFTVGPSTMSPAAVQTSSSYGGAQDVTVQISTWSKKQNDNEVSAVKSKLHGAVRDATWSPSTGTIIRVRLLDGGQILKEPNPQATYQGISEFEFRIQLPTL